jgi:uncharacterized membrane protein YhaH (DUF805 family)
MRPLSLLFDPRGAIDRRAFWSGLIQLTLVSVAVCLGLGVLEMDGGLAALPVIGEVFVVNEIVSHAYASSALDTALAASVLLFVARLYATACLMLKRSRHAGKDPAALAIVGLAALLIHGLMGLWAYDLFDNDMAVILPLGADIMLTAGLSTVFTVWLGAARPSTSSDQTRGQVPGLAASRG